MVVDAVRTYLDAANGLTELSRKQAVAAAKTLLRANGATPSAVPDGETPPRVGQSIQTLAGELIETSQANRAAVAELVRSEVRSALEQMDMVPRAEHERMVRRVAELERRMAARHAVERVLEPRGGASSELPVEEKAPVEPEAVAEAPESVVPEPVASEPEVPEAAPEADKGDGEARETAATEDGDGAKGDDAGNQASDGAAKTKPRTTRSRSTAKRTTKGKGAKK